jgi:DNA-binding MarR family transcriptional regulator
MPTGRPESTGSSGDRVPSVVGVLRQASLSLRAEMIERIYAAGFTDITFAQVAIFRREGPHGRRPTEIAAAAELSKQSVNDTLRYFETLGYLRLKPDPSDGRARVVHLTARGRRLDVVIWKAGRDVERGWSDRIGEPAWSTFQAVVDQIAQAGVDAMADDED